jgi:hypothetical protein
MAGAAQKFMAANTDCDVNAVAANAVTRAGIRHAFLTTRTFGTMRNSLIGRVRGEMLAGLEGARQNRPALIAPGGSAASSFTVLG